MKGIVSASKNRDEIANVLSNEIKDFKIVGSTIDNISMNYNNHFARQLERMFRFAN
jgi:ribosome-binding factor A